MKELVWTRTNWIWLNAKSLRINMFQTNTEKWVNFSVKVSLCIDVYRNARLRTSTNLYIISLAISDIINAVIFKCLLLWVSLLQGNGLLVRQSAISTPSSTCFLFTYPQPRWDWRPSTDTSASLSLKTTHESSLIPIKNIYRCSLADCRGVHFNSQDGRLNWISLLRWIRRLHRWTTHRSLEDSSLYHCRLFFLSSSTRSCISFLLQGIQENKTSQSKHGFDGPRRGQRKSIDCQTDQAYQIARHCCVRLRTVLDSILDHCGDTALRFWCCRST